jgi:superoxide dismutase
MDKKDTNNSSTVLKTASPHVLPPLPYAENAFEPVISKKGLATAAMAQFGSGWGKCDSDLVAKHEK